MAQVTPRGHARRPSGAAKPASGARVSTTLTGAIHIAYSALQRTGRQVGLGHWEIDYARYCDRPINIGYEGRTTTSGRTRSMFIDMSVPCRKCSGCLRAKQREWTARAIAEMRLASRTWFVTFTLAPHNQAVMAYRARVRKASFPSLTEAEQFHRVHLEIGREMTLFMKRLRKATGRKLRYVYVVEPHKSGLPHYHMLLHELGFEVSKREIEAQWHLGFMKAKLANKSRAYYVCKYISKSAQCRVRASLRYGSQERTVGSDVVKSLLA